MRRKSFAARSLSMTPLIDIIFLLLLFFMLTSTFTRFAEIPLVRADSGAEPPDEDMRQLFVRLTQSQVTLNGQPLATDLAQDIAAVMDDDEAIALLSVGPDVTSQRFITTLEELQAIKALTVAVLQ